MEKFNYPIGSIVELSDHNVPHCGVVIDPYKTVELIAIKNKKLRKVFCNVVSIDLRITLNHPVNNKTPIYTLRQSPNYPWTASQIRKKIKALISTYDNSEYHIIYNNCQHFAWELSTGQRKSPDSDKYKLVGGAVGMLFNIKDFGINSNSISGSIAELNPLKSDLWRFLEMDI